MSTHEAHTDFIKSVVAQVSSTPLRLVLTSVSAILLIALIVRRLRKPDKTRYFIDELPKTVEEIPKHYFLSKWLPTFVNGLFASFRVRQEGIYFLRDVAASRGGLFESVVAHKRTYIVRDAVLIQKLLGSDCFHILNKPRVLYDFIFTDMLRYGQISGEKEPWYHQRKVTTPTFDYSRNPGHLAGLNKHFSNLLSFVPPGKDTIEGGEVIDAIICTQMIRMVAEFTCGPNSRMEKEADKFHHHARIVKKLVKYKTIARPENLFPPVWWLNPKRLTYNHHLESARAMVQHEITQHEEQMERNKMAGIIPDKKEMCTIEMLLDAQLPAREILDTSSSFMMAGHETSVAALYIFLQQLAEHPEYQRACQEEVDAVFATKTGNLPTDLYITNADLANLKFLEMCIMEGMRHCPSVPWFFRQLTGDLQIDGLKFKNGDIFCFSSFVVHKNTKYYPDPEKYDPYRWLPENIRQRPPASFLIFSYGPRNCPGWKMAIMQMKVAMAWLLKDFHVETTDKMSEMKHFFDATLYPDRDYNLTLRRRRSLK